jgi:hypothetical protein
MWANKNRILPFLIIIVIVCASAIWGRKMKGVDANRQAGDVKAKIERFSDSRISLLGPERQEFDALFNVQPLPDDLRNDIKDLSVFLENNSDQTIVAYSVRWEIGSQGIPRTISFADPIWLATPNLKPGNGVIAPYSRRFVSLLQGGNAISAQSDNSKIRKAIIKSARGLHNRFKGEQDWRVSIDGVIFADGRFIGENKGGFFEITKAKIEADRDFYRDLIADLGGGLKLNVLLRRRLAATEAAEEETQAKEVLTPNWFYKNRQRVLAQALIDSLDQVSEEDLLKAISVENGKSRAVIYR